jgi:hypothetical protein
MVRGIFKIADDLKGQIKNIVKPGTIDTAVTNAGITAGKNPDLATTIAKNAETAAAAAKNADTAAAAAKNADTAATAAKNADTVTGKITTKQAIGAAALTIGVAGGVVATTSFNNNSNKLLTIVSMKAGINSGDIIITYSPEATFVDNDSVLFHETTGMVPSHINEQFPVLKIISTTQISINIPDVTVYATTGTVELKTTMDNRIEQTAKNGTTVVTSVGAGVGSGILSQTSQIFGPYLIYIQSICGLICCLFIIFMIWKIYSMTKSL